ncbi:MAG: ABC transporter permease [Oscillospiraceae bacterium]|nr:ABC transporter permease [Oscillospiraceae bacterium]
MIKRIILIAVNVLCLIGFFICLGVSSSIREPLYSQQAADAWRGQSGERFAQLSAFFPDDTSFDLESIRQLRGSIEQELIAASLESSPDNRLYADAWSGTGTVSVISSRLQNPVSVKAIAVGGDFFLFHPFRLVSGSYLSPEDVMRDRVVLDEELAWRLFGATRVEGFEVVINSRPFLVAGVISRETDLANSRAYTYGEGLFMSFEALMVLSEEAAVITSYEIVMPDPVTGFARGTLTDAITESNILIIENSNRFSLLNTFLNIRSFGERSMHTDSIALPYWENAARFVEDWLALLLVLSLVLITFPIVCAVIYIVNLIRFGLRHGKNSLKNLIKARDDRLYKKYVEEHGDEVQIYSVDDIIREVKGE